MVKGMNSIPHRKPKRNRDADQTVRVESGMSETQFGHVMMGLSRIEAALWAGVSLNALTALTEMNAELMGLAENRKHYTADDDAGKALDVRIQFLAQGIGQTRFAGKTADVFQLAAQERGGLPASPFESDDDKTPDEPEGFPRYSAKDDSYTQAQIVQDVFDYIVAREKTQADVVAYTAGRLALAIFGPNFPKYFGNAPKAIVQSIRAAGSGLGVDATEGEFNAAIWLIERSLQKPDNVESYELPGGEGGTQPQKTDDEYIEDVALAMEAMYAETGKRLLGGPIDIADKIADKIENVTAEDVMAVADSKEFFEMTMEGISYVGSNEDDDESFDAIDDDSTKMPDGGDTAVLDDENDGAIEL